MKTAIVGAGPAGLFLAILLKDRMPGLNIRVYEQNPRDATFGFGVVLADNGLARIRSASPEVHDGLVKAMHFNNRQTIVSGEKPIQINRSGKGKGGGAIPRIEMLSILNAHAEKRGIELLFNHRIKAPDQLGADLIVGADGVHSQVRGWNEVAFGTRSYLLDNRFAWYGVKKPFPNPALVFRQWNGGHFVAHYYPYSDTMSTFVAECDAPTWSSFGMESMSDEERKAMFETVFAVELDGYPLVSNNSVYRRFPVIQSQQWHVGNTVLIGDALNSAHFSIGSGTRIAMEDAISLAEALGRHPNDVSLALHSYQQARQPEKAKLIDAAKASFDWYERIGTWMEDCSPEQFVYQFMTRTGRIGLQRLQRQFPELVQQFSDAGVLENEG